MSASNFDFLPAELNYKILNLLCDNDKLNLFCLNAFRSILCNQLTWKHVDFDTIENISPEVIELFEAVRSQVHYLTWQLGHIWHLRRLCHTVGTFSNLKELDLSGNTQIINITFLRNLNNLSALCLQCCYNLSSDSTVNVIRRLNGLKWLDISECGQFSHWDVEQIVLKTRKLHTFNICGTKGYTLAAIRRIALQGPFLESFRFCAIVDAHRVEMWRPILQDDYEGPLKMCSAMREIVMHYIVM